MNKHIAGIVLAAGGSSRMRNGLQKLLLPLGNHPVIVHVVAAAQASQLHPLVVVVGNRAQEIRSTLTDYLSAEQVADLLFVENSDYTKGMSTSLRTGVSYLIENYRSDIGGAMILLGDQPFVTTEVIDTLIGVKHTEDTSIIAPHYNGKRGNPVIFPTKVFSELLEVVGDEGGKSVIERYRQEVRAVDIADIAQNHDVDTWEAYQQALAMWQKGQEE